MFVCVCIGVCLCSCSRACSECGVCVAYVACGMWCPTTQHMSTDDCANCLIGEHFWLCWRPFANLTPIHTHIHTQTHTHTPLPAMYISVSVSRAATLTAYSKCFFSISSTGSQFSFHFTFLRKFIELSMARQDVWLGHGRPGQAGANQALGVQRTVSAAQC